MQTDYVMQKKKQRGIFLRIPCVLGSARMDPNQTKWATFGDLVTLGKVIGLMNSPL